MNCEAFIYITATGKKYQGVTFPKGALFTEYCSQFSTCVRERIEEMVETGAWTAGSQRYPCLKDQQASASAGLNPSSEAEKGL